MIDRTLREACTDILCASAKSLSKKIQSFDFDGCVKLKTANVCGDKYYSKSKKVSANVEMTDLYHTALETLSNKGYFTLRFDKNILAYDELHFTSEQARTTFEASGEIPEFEIKEAVQGAIEPFKASKHIKVREFANNFKSFAKSLPDAFPCESEKLMPSDYGRYWTNVLRGSEAILELQEDCLVKNLSKQIFGNSKVLERCYMPAIARILEPEILENRFDGRNKCSVQDVFELHHVYRVPPSVSIRGNCRIKYVTGYEQDLSHYNWPVYLSLEEIDEIVSCDCDTIMTVENETTFASVPRRGNVLIIESRGYARSIVLRLLNTVVRCTGINVVNHFGDLDPAGFKISKNLNDRLRGATVRRVWMNADFWSRFEGAENMQDWQRAQFEAMLQDDYYDEKDKEMFRLLLSENKVAEQEGFHFPR